MCFRPPSFDDMMTKCPKCGSFNDPEADKCKKCGTDLTNVKGMGDAPVPGAPTGAPKAPGAPAGAPKAPGGAPKAPGA